MNEHLNNKSIKMKQIHKTTLIFFACLLIMSALMCSPLRSDAEEPQDNTIQTAPSVDSSTETVQEGFINEANGTHYYMNGKSVTGRHIINGKVYYFDAKGVMQKNGWYTSKWGNTFYFTKNGTALVGVHTIKGKIYCFGKKGVMLKSTWYKISNSKKYYFSKNGAALTGKNRIKGKAYIFSKKGVMLKGLCRDYKTKKRYYTDKKTGVIKTGFVKMKGKTYYFSKKTGVMQTGFVKVNGRTYYFSKKYCYMLKGLQRIGGKKYYFKKNGVMATQKVKSGNILYYANKKGVIYRTVDGSKKMVALTFDDGPSTYTPLVLDTLDKYNAVATFFVVGNRVSTYSEYVKRAYNLGCEIATHTYDHAYLTRLTADQVRSEVQSGADAITKVTGVAPTLMRPPGGCVNSTVSANVGLPMIIWSVDTLDWKTRSTPTTISRVVDGAYDGAIILVHDLHQSTCIAAQTFIPKLIQNGYQLVTVSEMAELRGVKMEAGKSYYSFKR